MLGKRPKERFDDGFKIGSTSDATRPIAGTDVVVIEDASESDVTKSVRVGLVSDIFKDMSLGVPATTSATIIDNDGNWHTLTFGNGILTQYYMGTGTEELPLLISTPADLDNVRNGLDKHYKLNNDIDLSGYASWIPIGISESPFTGTLDGNNKTISNLTIDDLVTPHIGLFGVINGGGAHNIKMTSVTITANTSNATCGSLAGRSIDATYENIDVDIALNGGYAVGAIIGQSEDSQYTKIIGVITSISASDGGYPGGLIGMSDTDELNKCAASGNIEKDTEMGTNHGGLIGLSTGSTINNSYSLVALTGAFTMGGLIGVTTGDTITNCYYAGVITATYDDFEVGGIVGQVASTSSATHTYWDTDVSTIATDEYGAGKTTVTMKKQATFVDWDFDDIWSIEEDEGYPELKFITKKPR